MAALSAKRITEGRNLGCLRRYKLAGSATVYAGGAVMLKSDGYASAAAASASNKGVVGIAVETVTNSGADGADVWVTVQEGTFLFPATSIAIASVGTLVYFNDDNLIDETAVTNCPKGGHLEEVVSSTSGWVRVERALTV